jgi:hypothetical protein
MLVDHGIGDRVSARVDCHQRDGLRHASAQQERRRERGERRMTARR